MFDEYIHISVRSNAKHEMLTSILNHSSHIRFHMVVILIVSFFSHLLVFLIFFTLLHISFQCIQNLYSCAILRATCEFYFIWFTVLF